MSKTRHVSTWLERNGWRNVGGDRWALVGDGRVLDLNDAIDAQNKRDMTLPKEGEWWRQKQPGVPMTEPHPCPACGESSLTHDVATCVPVKRPGASPTDIHQRRCPYADQYQASKCQWCAGHQDAYDQIAQVKANPERLSIEDLLHERQTATEMLWRALVWEQNGAVPGHQLTRAVHALIEENQRNHERAGKAEMEVRRIRQLIHPFKKGMEDMLRDLDDAQG